MTPLLLVLGVGAGLAAWTVIEYGMHRYGMHHRPGRDLISREHLVHHADPEATSPMLRTLGHLGVAAVAAVAGLALSFVVGAPLAAGLAAGVSLGYSGYELLHWHAHHRAPRTRYGVRLRHRHFQHHFGTPRANYGVTIRLWDRVFGTDDPVRTVVVPERLTMPWLCDGAGAVLPAYRDDYEVRSGRRPSADSAAEDRRRAFADLPPLL